jgi:hypothetical protein
MVGLLFVAVLTISAASAFGGRWSLTLAASPNPVLAGTTATFSGTLVNPSGTQGVPDKNVVVRFYGHDATCTGTYAEESQAVTANVQGHHGDYTLSSGVPANASGNYYAQAFATLDDFVVAGPCTLITVTPAP